MVHPKQIDLPLTWTDHVNVNLESSMHSKGPEVAASSHYQEIHCKRASRALLTRKGIMQAVKEPGEANS